MKVLGDSKEWQFIRNEKSRRDNKIELLGYKEENLYPTRDNIFANLAS